MRPGRVTSALFVFASLTAAATLSACSPGMFFGDGKDDKIEKTKSYRKVNFACAGMDLSSPTISVPQARQILDCFNANGALEEVVALTRRLTDAEMQPLVDVGNEYLLTNRPLLYQIEQTYYGLKKQGILEDTLKQFGRLLENEEFIASGIQLLQETFIGSVAPGGNLAVQPRAIRGDEEVNEEILRAIERLAKKVNPQSVSSALDTGLALADSRAFKSLQRHFSSKQRLSPRTSAEHPRKSLQELSGNLLTYVQEIQAGKHIDAGRFLIDELISYRLFHVLDQTIGKRPDELQSKVPDVSAILHVSLADGGEIMHGITSLAHHANTSVGCMKGTMFIPNLAMHAVEELAQYHRNDAGYYFDKKNVLLLTVANPLCDFPAGILHHYPTLLQLSETTAVDSAGRFVGALYDHGLHGKLVNVLADTDSSETGGIKRVIPLLAELTDREVWDDLLLTLALPRLEDRDDFVDILKFLVDDQDPALNGKSIYDVLLSTVSKHRVSTLYQFVDSLKEFVEKDSSKPENQILVPALTALRKAYYVNNVHPFIDVAHDLMSKATQKKELYRTLFKTSQMKEFRPAMRLVSDMAKDDRLMDIMGSILTLFHRFALEGARVIEPATLPAIDLDQKRRHNLDMGMLGESPLAPRIGNEICRNVDMTFPSDQYEAGGAYKQHVDTLRDCLNSDGTHQKLADAIGFLRDYETSTEPKLNYFDFTIYLLKQVNLTAEMTGDLMGRLKSWLHAADGRFDRLLKIVPYWVNYEYGEGGNAGQVLRPLLNLVEPVLKSARAELTRLELFGAHVIDRDNFPYLLKYGERLYDQADELADGAIGPLDPSRPLTVEQEFASRPENYARYLKRVKRWVHNKECVRDWNPNDDTDLDELLDRRATDVIDSYRNAVNNWELSKTPAGKKTWRKDYTLDEFKRGGDLKGGLEELFTKFGDPAQNAPEKHSLKALLNILRYFSLSPGEAVNDRKHYVPDEMIRFLWKRSNDYKLISYYYPGEPLPRVRMVNSLDRLELILLNSDFMGPNLGSYFHQNFGQKFLADIGGAWGDEAYEVWPEAVRNEYKRTGKRPPTLKDAIDGLVETQNLFENVAGFPELPGCNQIADPADPKDVQWDETHDHQPYTSGLPSWTPLPGADVDLEEMQRRLYNIRQVLTIVLENLPNSGHPNTGGLKILRDIFYELYTSSPKEHRNSKAPWKNNLSVIMRLVKMGMIRNAGLQIRKYHIEAEIAARGRHAPRIPAELSNFFRGLVSAGTAPYAEPLLHEIFLNAKNRDHKLIWQILGEVFDVIDAARGKNLSLTRLGELGARVGRAEKLELQAEWAGDHAFMKQLGLYALAGLGQMDLVHPTIKTLSPIMSGHKDFLTRHSDKLNNVFRSRKLSRLLRALHNDASYCDALDKPCKSMVNDLLFRFLNDGQYGANTIKIVALLADHAEDSVSGAFNLFDDRHDLMSSDPGYVGLDAGELGRYFLHFFQEVPADPKRRTAERLRKFVAERIRLGQIDELLKLAAEDPDGFYRVLELPGHYVQTGELKSIFDVMDRTLDGPYEPAR